MGKYLDTFWSREAAFTKPSAMQDTVWESKKKTQTVDDLNDLVRQTREKQNVDKYTSVILNDTYKETTPLQEGSTDTEKVKKLQKELRTAGFYWFTDSPSGTFDAQLTYSVKKFQESRKLNADGIVGPATWKQLGTKMVDTAILKEWTDSYIASNNNQAFNTNIKNEIAGIQSKTNGVKKQSNPVNAQSVRTIVKTQPGKVKGAPVKPLQETTNLPKEGNGGIPLKNADI